MKSKRFISSVTLLILLPVIAWACGPYDSMTSNPLRYHFYQQEDFQDTESAPIVELNQKRNIRLWQSLTDSSVPEDDIREGVYDMSLHKLQKAFAESSSENRFIAWIKRPEATQLKNFLLLAKELEELRANRVSAWYYPTDKTGFDAAADEKNRFDSILAVCGRHQSGPLADRYALQAIRAMMSLHDWQGVIDRYNAVLASYPDSNLFKQMAKGYMAGCLSRIGETEKANTVFAEIGDFNSLGGKNYDNFMLMAHVNPESPIFKTRLNGFIGYGDSEENKPYLSIADAALKSPKVINRGDWLYLKAYIEAVYNKNSRKAGAYIRQALKTTFSHPEMRKDARIFDICMRARNGRLTSPLSEIAKSLGDDDNTAALLFYVIPALLKQNRTTDALLLANLGTADYRQYYEGDEDTYSYANTGFQLLLSCTARQVVAYKDRLDSGQTPLVSKIRHDNDYLNEIIGTLYLREGNYDKAAYYLSLVSPGYQKSLNIYKEGYLAYDPFVYNYTPEDKWYYPAYKSDYEYTDDRMPRPKDETSKVKKLNSPKDAKLNFAREMSRLAGLMRHGKTPDERNMARLRYAIGRYNSFNSCWALTQYWAGNANQSNYQPFYWTWDGETRGLDYITDVPRQLKEVDEAFEREINDIIGSLKSPEALAQANFLLRNYRTIARRYPDSPEARYLSAHCDRWHDWL